MWKGSFKVKEKYNKRNKKRKIVLIKMIKDT